MGERVEEKARLESKVDFWGMGGMEERETRRFSGAGRNSPNRWNINKKTRSLPHL